MKTVYPPTNTVCGGYKNLVELPWEGGRKVCINGPGHMTKMAAMPIYDKNLQKSFPEPEDL